MKIKVNPEEFEVRYTNWVSMLVYVLKPKDLYFIGGRGTAKTTDIEAMRTIDIIHDMPGATFSFVSDTYVNALSNVIPELRSGWKRQKFHEHTPHQIGHYVVDKEPPYSWPRPNTPASEYKHTIHTFNGCKFLIKSLDRPSMNAGISVQHMIGDEVKYFKLLKLKKALPTLRGDYLLYKDSPYFMGMTFFTDMPNPSDGDEPWILDMEKQVDKKMIIHLFYAAITVNEIEWELYQAKKAKSTASEIENIKLKLQRWKERLLKIRKKSMFFYIVSTLANIDVLTFEYLIKQFKTLEYHEFKTAILSIYAGISKDTRFYGNFSDKHIYNDGYNYDYYDQFNLNDNITRNSVGLRFVQPNKILDAGLDVGNMMSLVIGQDQGKTYRILKNMYVLVPEWFRELADDFIKFWEPHKFKVLELYYDRAANNYAKAKQDFATQFKEAVEKDASGKRTGWTVRLMSRGGRNIGHDEEYNLMNQLMGSTNKGLPDLLIDKHECKELISSIKLAPLEKNPKGGVKKVKKSEKLPLKRLPFESTNFSDAFKYLMCRPKWLNMVKGRKSVQVGNATVRG